jgi:hypothetical protein
VLPSWEICAKLEAKYPELIAKLQEGVRYIRVLPEEDDPSSGTYVGSLGHIIHTHGFR